MTSTKNGWICDPILKKTMKKNNQKKKKNHTHTKNKNQVKFWIKIYEKVTLLFHVFFFFLTELIHDSGISW